MESIQGETVVWRGRPSWKALLLYYILWSLVSLVPAALWIVLQNAGTDVPATWFFGATLVGLVVTYVGGWIKRATTRYTVTDRRITIRTGLASRSERSTHVDRVQNVHMRQGVFERILGIGNVDWDTAGTGEAEADFTFRGIDDPSHLVQLVDRYYGRAASETARPPV
jgi:putative membrane protein